MKGKKTDVEKDAKKKKRWKLIMTKVTELDRQVQKLTKEFATSSTRAEEARKRSCGDLTGD